MKRKYLNYSALLFLFFVVLGVLVKNYSLFQKIDVNLLKSFQGNYFCKGQEVFWKVVTSVASKKIFIILSSSFLLLFLFLRKNFYALLLFLNLLFSEAIKDFFKFIFARRRPNFNQLVGISSKFSFPSGHTLLFFILLFSISLPLIFSARKKWFKYLIILFWFILSLGEGLSRICLGVHWPFDILGSFLLGGAIIYLDLFLIFKFYLAREGRR